MATILDGKDEMVHLISEGREFPIEDICFLGSLREISKYARRLMYETKNKTAYHTLESRKNISTDFDETRYPYVRDARKKYQRILEAAKELDQLRIDQLEREKAHARNQISRFSQLKY